MNNIRHLQRSGRLSRSLPVWPLWKVLPWTHSMSWSKPCWRLTTITCKCCSDQTVFRKDKKQGRTYVFKCQQCKLRWIGKMPPGAEITNVYKYEDGQIVQWTRGERSKAAESNKPNLAGDGHGWNIPQEEPNGSASTITVPHDSASSIPVSPDQS